MNTTQYKTGGDGNCHSSHATEIAVTTTEQQPQPQKKRKSKKQVITISDAPVDASADEVTADTEDGVASDTTPTRPLKSNLNTCPELKSIQYKTMLLKGVIMKTPHSEADNLETLDAFLENEKSSTNNQWCKLNKTIKVQKFLHFAELYSKEHNFTEDETTALMEFLKDCLDRKKLQRIKDVNYDKISGEIRSIPGLIYNKTSKHFTLKNLDKHVSTLKSLAPTKTSAAAAMTLKRHAAAVAASAVDLPTGKARLCESKEEK